MMSDASLDLGGGRAEPMERDIEQVHDEAPRRFWSEDDAFRKDGAPFQIIGDDVHYFRIVPEVLIELSKDKYIIISPSSAAPGCWPSFFKSWVYRSSRKKNPEKKTTPSNAF